ncbi:c-type cytochrome [Acidobacteriota bacterium]
MSFFSIKLILGLIFFLAGLGATITMLTVMGKTEKKMSVVTLRKMHKMFGFIFLILFLILGIMGSKFWASTGDEISARAVLHAVLALGLFIIFFLKIVIIQFYKQFLRIAPTLGMAVFCLSFVVFYISGGFYTLRTLSTPSPPKEQTQTPPAQVQGNIQSGKVLFDTKCANCHLADSVEKRIGPGLQDLLFKDTLPHSGRPATVENILSQFERPVLTMPAFKNLTEQELADLITYLKTL